MTAGDVGVILYAYSGSFDMTGGKAQLLVQLAQAGYPASTNPPTVGLPSPHGNQAALPPHSLLTLNVGGSPHTDESGVVHAPGTWANYSTVGTDFPVGGTYNTQLRCTLPATPPYPAPVFTSKVVQFFVDPVVTP